MAVRRRSGFSRNASKRMSSWFTIDLASTAIASNTAVLVSSYSAAALAKRPFTIVRTQLTIHLTTDQLAASEFQAVALGMCVVSDQASAIGVSAVPTPDTDSASDLWYLHRWLFDQFDFGDATGFQSNAGLFLHIDSKAMRKVNDDEDSILVVESGAISSGSLLVVGGRQLIKEH